MSLIKSAASIGDIEARLKDIGGLIGAIPVSNAGSLLRVSMRDYYNWGILVTKENAGFLKSMARDAYMIEWQETGDNLNALVATASKNAGLGDVNAKMNKRIGEIVASDYIVGPDYVSSITFDIGTGTGHPSFEVYEALQAKGLRSRSSKDKIILNDPSKKRIAIAESTIKGMPFWEGNKNNVIVGIGQDIEVLNGLPKGSVRNIISNAAIHHHSDNEHLNAIYEVLAPRGLFTNGDWHESMWQTPARTYWMFAALKEDLLGNRELANNIVKFVADKGDPTFLRHYADRPELKEFRNYFGISMEKAIEAFINLTEQERSANAGIMRFWRSVGTTFAEAHETAPIKIFEAHETVHQREKNMARSGLGLLASVTIGTGYGELATVMAFIKLRK